MNSTQAASILFIFIFFTAIELWRGRFFTALATREDKRLDTVVMTVGPLAIAPIILLMGH